MLLLGLALVAMLIKTLRDADKKNKQKPPAPVPPPVVDPGPANPWPNFPLLPTRREVYSDDFVKSLTADKGGDFNAPNDFFAVLCLYAHFGYKPLAFVCSCVGGNRGLGVEAMRSVAELAGFGDVPVLAGNEVYDPGDSEAARFYARESSKGLKVCGGGPVNDLRDALNHVIDTAKMPLVLIAKGTWNEHTDPRTRDVTVQATADVYRRFPDITDVLYYRAHLSAPKGAAWNEDWIKRVRAKSALARVCFSDFINAQNRHANARDTGVPNPIRMADSFTVYLANGKNARDFGGFMSAVEHGAELIEAWTR